MEFFLQLVINGLVVGAIYSLVALGFVIIFKSSGILNFAQGEFLLLGAYVFLAIVAQANVPTLPALLLTFAFATLLGLALERVILRPLIGEPIISVIMVTLGLSSVLRAIVQGIWGTDTRPVPAVFSLDPVQLGPLPVARGYLYSADSVAAYLPNDTYAARPAGQVLTTGATIFNFVPVTAGSQVIQSTSAFTNPTYTSDSFTVRPEFSLRATETIIWQRSFHTAAHGSNSNTTRRAFSTPASASASSLRPVSTS